MIVTPNSTSFSLDIQIVDDTGLAVTGLVSATFPALSWSLNNNTAATSITTSDLAAITTAYSSGGVKERSGGFYRVDLPNASLTTAGEITIIGDASGKHVISPKIIVANVPATVAAYASNQGPLYLLTGANNQLHLNSDGSGYVGGFLNTALTEVHSGDIAGAFQNCYNTTVKNFTMASANQTGDNFSGRFTGGAVASVTGTVGAALSVSGTVGAALSVTGNVNGNVVGSVGSVNGTVGAAASVSGTVGAALSVSGTVGAALSVTGNVGGNVVGSVGSVSGTVGASLDSGGHSFFGSNFATLAVLGTPVTTIAGDIAALKAEADAINAKTYSLPWAGTKYLAGDMSAWNAASQVCMLTDSVMQTVQRQFLQHVRDLRGFDETFAAQGSPASSPATGLSFLAGQWNGASTTTGTFNSGATTLTINAPANGQGQPAPNMLVTISDGANTETLTMTSGYTAGSTTFAFTAGLAHTHTGSKTISWTRPSAIDRYLPSSSFFQTEFLFTAGTYTSPTIMGGMFAQYIFGGQTYYRPTNPENSIHAGAWYHPTLDITAGPVRVTAIFPTGSNGLNGALQLLAYTSEKNNFPSAAGTTAVANLDCFSASPGWTSISVDLPAPTTFAPEVGIGVILNLRGTCTIPAGKALPSPKIKIEAITGVGGTLLPGKTMMMLGNSGFDAHNFDGVGTTAYGANWSQSQAQGFAQAANIDTLLIQLGNNDVFASSALANTGFMGIVSNVSPSTNQLGAVLISTYKVGQPITDTISSPVAQFSSTSLTVPSITGTVKVSPGDALHLDAGTVNDEWVFVGAGYTSGTTIPISFLYEYPHGGTNIGGGSIVYMDQAATQQRVINNTLIPAGMLLAATNKGVLAVDLSAAFGTVKHVFMRLVGGATEVIDGYTGYPIVADNLHPILPEAREYYGATLGRLLSESSDIYAFTQTMISGAATNLTGVNLTSINGVPPTLNLNGCMNVDAKYFGGSAVTSLPLNAGQVAVAVLDAAQSAHTNAGSIGLSINNANAPTLAAISAQIITDHGAGPYGSSAGGSGANPLEVIVTDGTNPISNATVRLSSAIVLQSNGSGKAEFSLDPATYNLAITYGGASYTPTSQTVNSSGDWVSSGGTSITAAMTPAVISTPTQPGECIGVALICDTSDTPISGASLDYRIFSGDGTNGIFDRDIHQAISGTNGIVQVPMIHNFTFQLRYESGPWINFIVPASGGTCSLSQVLGRLAP